MKSTKGRRALIGAHKAPQAAKCLHGRSASSGSVPSVTSVQPIQNVHPRPQQSAFRRRDGRHHCRSVAIGGDVTAFVERESVIRPGRTPEERGAREIKLDKLPPRS